MSDRCGLEAIVATKNARKLLELFDTRGDLIDNSDGTTTVLVYEANYGLFEERAENGACGFPWYGSHGAGSEYGPMAFACDGKVHVECTATQNGAPVVGVDDDGTVNAGDLKLVHAYQRVLKRARRALGRLPPKKDT